MITNDNHVTYSLVIIDNENIKCHALIDAEAGRSYASSTLIDPDRINKKPISKQYRHIETIMGSSNKSIPIYSVETPDSDQEFKLYQNKSTRENKDGASQGANSRTNKTILGFFNCLENKTLQLRSCLLRRLCMTMRTYVL